MANLENDCIDRIFRGLFVYSVGFYEMLDKALHHAKHKYTLLSSVWKVYSILLEYCCQSNYQMMITKIRSEHDQQLEELKASYESEIETLRKREQELTKDSDELNQEKNELRKRLEQEVFLRIKL